MNTILEKSDKMRFFTDLRLVFTSLGDRQREFNWLITDLECNCYPDSRIPYDSEGKPYWFSGDELTEIVYNNDIQFIWAVLSGFKKELQINLEDLAVYPCAENPNFWGANPKIQHPLATVELVCWDSSYTLLLSKDDNLTKSFRSYFPEADDLNKYNLKW